MKQAVLTLFLFGACGGDEPASIPYPKLSDWGFFEGTGSTQQPKPGIVPYDLNAPLFADFAAKHRFLALPPGGKISYQDTDKWQFPVGTVIIKTFSFYADLRDTSKGERLIETRLIIHQADGWLPVVYLWNDAQTEATLFAVGARVNVSWIDETGAARTNEYRVPNTNQCLDCHGQRGSTNVLGPRTRQINHSFDYGHGLENQIDHMVALGMFDGPVPGAASRQRLPNPYDAADGTVETRARAWLEGNCAHCHRSGGAAGSTGLYLSTDITTPIDFGVCRLPNAAGAASGGRMFDVVAGHPEESVLSYRIASTVAGIKMPAIPILLVDQAGVDAVNAWIQQMPAMPCN